MCGLIWFPARAATGRGELLQIPADVGHGHRVAGERDRDAGAQFDRRGVLGGQREQQERVVTDLRGPAAVVAELFDLTRAPGHVSQPGHDAAVDL